MNLVTAPDRSHRRMAAVGMFDGVHTGHRCLLDCLVSEAARRSLAPAAVTFSRHPLTLIDPTRAPGLLGTLESRVELLEQAGVADVVVLPFNEGLRSLGSLEFLRLLKEEFAVDALVLGYDNRFGSDTPRGIGAYREAGHRAGVEIIPAPRYEGPRGGVSSSAVRGAVARGDMESAALMLGRPYTLRGRVVPGRQLGRKLGFATANVEPHPSLLLPATGVYAAMATTPDGKRRPAVVNVGYRPTVEPQTTAPGHSSPPLTVEAHIIDWTGYIYDEELTLEFVHMLRPERKFESPSRLAAQVKADIANAKKICSLPS